MNKAIAILAGGLALCWLGAVDTQAQTRGAPKAGESQPPAPKATPLPPGPRTEQPRTDAQPEDDMAPGEGQTCPDQGRKLNLIV